MFITQRFEEELWTNKIAQWQGYPVQHSKMKD